MVEGNLDTEKGACTGANCTQSGSQGSIIHRDPSFSRWCDEDGNLLFDSNQLGDAQANLEEDSDFELPLLQQGEIDKKGLDTDRSHNTKFQQISTHLKGGDTMDNASIHVEGNGNEKFAPFDIENNGTMRETDGVDGSNFMHKHRPLPPTMKNTVSVANVLKTLFFILLWYTFSLFLTLYNKSLLGDDMGRFPAPLLMNTVHFAMQAILSKAITWYWSNRFQPSVAMSWKDYFMRVVPTALGTAMDVNLSNASLVSISVTFATMCKSAAPIFLLLFAFAFRLESPSIKLSGIMLVISTGILLTVAKETEFEFGGFILVMLAAVMSGFRWCMTQILLQKETYGLKNPLTLMSYVTPVMTFLTAILSIILDPWKEFRVNVYFNSQWHVARSCLLMLFGGMLAFFMVLTEYVLISVTSAVTVTIAGVVKEAVTILVAVFYFHDEFTWLKGAGLFTIMVGVGLFNWYKYHKLQSGHTSEGDTMDPLSDNAGAKYVILEEMDEQDDGN
ncbi:probable sugar phosphate/phosphate translocator At1g06470 isoform X1 [Ziziphus jujuba]|uniref:Probable sugar phosphate/phosphate translocator At1g06470 isoform X1 n=1 Tax=Ziziphus jujuba TaxID=326968 RepID=A0ABM3IFY1_ZIZJJ|nr:probable sugar phosphate/phosphate translocator At1g06470 isoform X1 [Ziziphus jujuba]XP_048327615.2 probable sugar phosphate/phosphate translocator At1g06470 isoform X1 [Ziziphus jujuba]